MNTKKIVLAFVLLLMPIVTFAASGGAQLDHVQIDARDTSSLQRGAKVFMNYCLGCHSADYQRYNRMAADIGLSDAEVSENLIFTTDDAGERTKVGSLIFNTMTSDYGKQAFGVKPPNLALTARSRGTDWLYTYLRTFYLDPSRPIGVNNVVFEGVGMPHVLWKLQGWKKPVYEMHKDENGHESEVLTGFEQVTEGSLSETEYDNTIRDLVNFMAYIADPIKVERQRIGVLVLLFLFVLLGITYAVKKEYWKDVIK